MRKDRAPWLETVALFLLLAGSVFVPWGWLVGYADSVHGSRSLSDGVRVERFERCGRDEARSRAGRRHVTFWSGFILTNGPRCVRLKLWIDGASAARRVGIPIGRRC